MERTEEGDWCSRAFTLTHAHKKTTSCTSKYAIHTQTGRGVGLVHMARSRRWPRIRRACVFHNAHNVHGDLQTKLSLPAPRHVEPEKIPDPWHFCHKPVAREKGRVRNLQYPASRVKHRVASEPTPDTTSFWSFSLEVPQESMAKALLASPM